MAESTRERILDAALRAYGTDGFAATSLDALAADLGIRKQTILYYFPSKHAVFEAVVDRAASDLVKVFEEEAARGIDGLDQVEAIVKRVFRLAVRRPQLLGLIREVTRPGSLSIDRLSAHTAPIFDRARDFLQREMACTVALNHFGGGHANARAGNFRFHDAPCINRPDGIVMESQCVVTGPQSA